MKISLTGKSLSLGCTSKTAGKIKEIKPLLDHEWFFFAVSVERDEKNKKTIITSYFNINEETINNPIVIVSDFYLDDFCRIGFGTIDVDIPDPLNPNYSFIILQNELKYTCIDQSYSILRNVDDFDVSSKFLIVTTLDGKIQCFPRVEGSLVPIWEHNKQSGDSSYYITNEYFIEKVNSSATIYNASSKQLIQQIEGVSHIFKCKDPVFLMMDGSLIYEKKQFLFDQNDILYAFANKQAIVIWRENDWSPYVYFFELNAIKENEIFDNDIKKNNNELKMLRKQTIEFTKNYFNKFNERNTMQSHIHYSFNQMKINVYNGIVDIEYQKKY